MNKNTMPVAIAPAFESAEVSAKPANSNQQCTYTTSSAHAYLRKKSAKVWTAAFSAFSLLATLVSPAFADWHCQCGAIVHVNYPTTCPVCNRSLPNTPPPFTLPGSNANDGTGLRLGVNIFGANGRVLVESVQPGTPAQGKLYPNDQLVKGAFRDPLSGQVYRVEIYSPDDLTRLKALAGAGTKVALEVFRPTSGTSSFFISFAADGVVTRSKQRQPTNGRANSRSQSGPGSTNIVEDTTGEAAQWLNAGGGPTVKGRSSVVYPGAGDSPADLLNGR